MRLGAVIPQTEEQSTDGSVENALLARPRLRSMRARSLAQALNVSEDDALRGLSRLTLAATGMVDTSGRSLDERLALHGNAAPAASWREAGGIADWPYAMRREPEAAGTGYFWVPVGQYGSAWTGYLDAAIPIGYRWSFPQPRAWTGDESEAEGAAFSVFGRGMAQLSEREQSFVREVWARWQAMDPLPEDFERDNPQIKWPNDQSIAERQVYFWALENWEAAIDDQGHLKPDAKIDDARPSAMMQLQKFEVNSDPTKQGWRVYNQNGVPLLFRRTGRDRWEAGWDFGNWFAFHGTEIVDAIWKVGAAIATGVGFMMGGAVGAAMAAGIIGIEKAIAEGAQKLATGDVAGALDQWTKAAAQGAALYGNNATFKAAVDQMGKAVEGAQVIPGSVIDLFTKTVGAAKSFDLSALRQGASLVAKVFPQITQDVESKLRNEIPAQLRPFFDWGAKSFSGPMPVLPWYAQVPYVMGATTAATKNAQRLGAGSNVGAPGYMITVRTEMSATALRALELLKTADLTKATADEYCRSAQVMRDHNRPTEAAILQKQCDDARAEEARLRAEATKLEASATGGSGGSALPVVVGGGLLAALLGGFIKF